MGTPALAGQGADGPTPVPVAFLGRTSTLVLQNPRASLRRQVRATQEKLPPGFWIAAYFWDIESGGLDSRTGGTPIRGSRPTPGCPATAGWPTCWPRPARPGPGSPPSSARTSSAPAATRSTP